MVGAPEVGAYEGKHEGAEIRLRLGSTVAKLTGVSEGCNSLVAMDGNMVASPEGYMLGIADGNRIGAREGVLETETVDDMFVDKFVVTIEGKALGLSEGTALAGKLTGWLLFVKEGTTVGTMEDGKVMSIVGDIVGI
jgi:hypothetical protein